MMTAQELESLLLRFPDGSKACEKSIEWSHGKTLQQAYDECERADYMLYFFRKMCGQPGWPSVRQVVGTAARCAETVLHIYETKYPDNNSPRECIEACYRYERGEIDEDELKKYAAAYADTYAADAAAYAATYAAYVAYVAYAYDAAAYAAYAAACAANAAAYAAADAAATTARHTHHLKMCAIIREHLKLPEAI
jgi:hypothetical protein